jgi:hypothetical protein
MTDAQIALLSADIFLAAWIGKHWMNGVLFLIHIVAAWTFK